MDFFILLLLFLFLSETINKFTTEVVLQFPFLSNNHEIGLLFPHDSKLDAPNYCIIYDYLVIRKSQTCILNINKMVNACGLQRVFIFGWFGSVRNRWEQKLVNDSYQSCIVIIVIEITI